jgi:hypothetical protein
MRIELDDVSRRRRLSATRLAIVATVPILTLAMTGCGGSTAAKPDGGTQADATFVTDTGAPSTDASDAAMFVSGNGWSPHQATAVTAKVFASIEGGYPAWVSPAGDGTILVGGTARLAAFGEFYGTGMPLAVPGGGAFVARLDRQGNTMWATGYGVEISYLPVAVLPDGASIHVTDATVVSVFRLEADGQVGWKRDYGSNGPTFTAAVATAEGDVILAGEALGTEDFDPGPGVLAARGPFLMKLAGATGEQIWLRTPTQMEAGWRGPLHMMVRSDGRLVIRCTTSAPYNDDGLVMLSADGTADSSAWQHFFANYIIAWTLLPSGDILVNTTRPGATGPDDFPVLLLDGATGRQRWQQFGGGYYEIAAGQSRVVGLMEQGSYWALDYWDAAGSLEGGLTFAPEPDGYGQRPAGVAVTEDGLIVVVAYVLEPPAGATFDLDPGPGVTSYVTPNAYNQLVITVLAP